MTKIVLALVALTAILSGTAFAGEATKTAPWTTTTGPAAMSDSDLDAVSGGQVADPGFGTDTAKNWAPGPGRAHAYGLGNNANAQGEGQYVTPGLGKITAGQVTVSDARLKADIVQVAHLDNGLALYRYRYKWSDQVYVGVMAQEVALVRSDAVVRGADGYLRVDYSRLGLHLMSWEEWVASRPFKTAENATTTTTGPVSMNDPEMDQVTAGAGYGIDTAEGDLGPGRGRPHNNGLYQNPALVKPGINPGIGNTTAASAKP